MKVRFETARKSYTTYLEQLPRRGDKVSIDTELGLVVSKIYHQLDTLNNTHEVWIDLEDQ